ncbi:hypothetical protein SADO_03050 [Salinisphaera dokdonensis CL-ES53]|uniref:PepSY domain-containing protein n=1 Tax=Salinisphaera dokdonensis CL-ES53 TaxID=1304272 RepID=A0ABV2AX28_9GAMM
MSRFNNRIAPFALAAALVAGPGVALAQTGTSDNTKSIVDVVQMLESKDYTNIDSIDREMDRYEVEATDPAGQHVELTVDGKTGEVLHSERDDD